MSSFQTLTVYLGSSGFARDIFKDAAVDMGRLIGAHKKDLVYGGMDAGLMGLIAETAMQGGAKVTGIVPEKIRDSERILKGLSETIMVHDLWDRKKRMFETADIVVTLPGGFGTMDETLEMLYWGYLSLHKKPLVLVNIAGYWNDMIAYLQSLPDYDPRFLICVDTPEDVFTLALDENEPPEFAPGLQDRYPHFEDEITRDTHAPILLDIPSIENSYYFVCALGLKQLGKHNRPMGILNQNGVHDSLISWFHAAQKEKFITEKCLGLFDSAADEDALFALLKNQKDVSIDLHTEKWGEQIKNR